MRWLAGLAAIAAFAQGPRKLTLDEAEQLALRNHPRIVAAAMNSQAAASFVQQVKSAYQPLLTGNLTTVGADPNTVIGAGALQVSGLSSRAAAGIGVSQLLTDFGRTGSLVQSAKLRAEAQGRGLDTTRAQILLQVDQAYYAVLASDSVLEVARARVEMQRLTLRQVQALASSSLKSTLDVSFAEVSLSEAELALYQAENTAKANRALLTAATGETQDTPFETADIPLPGPLAEDRETSVANALNNRPELAAAKLTHSAAERFADAERRLSYPVFAVVAAAGAIPVHTKNLSSTYAAAGVNISLPVLNGGLFAARHAEAEYKARGTEKEMENLSLQIAAAARVAWIEADNTWKRLDVTARLVNQATTALRLATARYEIGLSGILELTQAQLALISAQIVSATAKYDYLNRLAALKYATGGYR